jgi:S1-C subfamily serine protease
LTALDWGIVGFTVLMALWGYSQGLIVSALSLAGFTVGALAGSRLAALLLSNGSHSPYAALFGLVGALLVGGLVAVLLEAVGATIRARLRFFAPLALIDGAGGAVLIAALGLGLVWVGGAAALHAPNARGLRKQVQHSVILRKLNNILPPTGGILNALSRADPFPKIRGPEARVRAPTRGIVRDPDVQAAHKSVVRILGTACGFAVEGSGWVAAPGVVVTNAHVVAGQSDTTAQPDGGPHLDAQAILFDPRNDVAILRVQSLLGAPALRQEASPRVGEPVAILGYPENGPYRAEPGRLGATQTVISQDAYGRGPITRRMTSLRGHIRSGNSGGPAIDAAGRVVATVFAATQSRPRGGFGVPPAIVASDLRRIRGPVDTGPCAI